MPRRTRFLLILLFALLSGTAAAQEAFHGEAATIVAPGRFTFRQQFHFQRLGDDPTGLEREVEDLVSLSRLTAGIAKGFSLSLDVPVIYRDLHYGDFSPFVFVTGNHGGHVDQDIRRGQYSKDLDLGDIALHGKFRLFAFDSGPIDTVRAAGIIGLEMPTGDDAFSSDSWDPFLGLAFTAIHGRHGANASAIWMFQTGTHGDPLDTAPGSPEMLMYGASYLFRLAPKAYDAAASRSATYFVLEATGMYETSGQHELMAGPGILYEGRDLALEFSVLLPVTDDLEHRPRTEFVFMVGLRFLF